MSHGFWIPLAVAVLPLNACSDESNGFLSDGNVCRPLTSFAEDSDADASEVPVAFEGENDLQRLALAQRTETAAADSEYWGAEFRLSAAVEAKAALSFTAYLSADDGDEPGFDESDIANVRTGSMVFNGIPLAVDVPATAGWVRARFMQPITVKSGEYLWLLLSAVDVTDKGVAWGAEAGSGLVEMTAGTDEFVPVVGRLGRHRLIACE